MITRIKEFIAQSRRVLSVTKKPGAEEYKQITKVSLIGIAILGSVGYTLFVLSEESLLGLPITAGLTAAIVAYLITTV
jgi:protein transport protein SEC61 subunit gamma-like protein